MLSKSCEKEVKPCSVFWELSFKFLWYVDMLLEQQVTKWSILLGKAPLIPLFD